MQEIVSGNESNKDLEFVMNSTIKKVSSDIETLKYNTAIAALMTLLNEIYDAGAVTKKELRTFITLLNPFAPHVTEEINELLGGDMLAVSPWPTYDEAKCVDAEVEIVAQVNGKVRAKLSVAADIDAADAIALAKADDKISAEIAGKTIVKELYVKGRLVNIVVK